MLHRLLKGMLQLKFPLMDLYSKDLAFCDLTKGITAGSDGFWVGGGGVGEVAVQILVESLLILTTSHCFKAHTGMREAVAALG